MTKKYKIAKMLNFFHAFLIMFDWATYKHVYFQMYSPYKNYDNI